MDLRVKLQMLSLCSVSFQKFVTETKTDQTSSIFFDVHVVDYQFLIAETHA